MPSAEFMLLVGSARKCLPPELEAFPMHMIRVSMAGAVNSLIFAVATALCEVRYQPLLDGKW